MQEAFSWPIGLDPLSVQDKLWNRALTGVSDYLRRGARCGFDIDLGVGNCVLAEETLGLAAIAAPVS